MPKLKPSNESPILKKRSRNILKSNLLHLLEITGTTADTISDLEFKLNSRDDDEKLHAQDEINALIDTLIKDSSRINSSTAIALKLYSDIFEHDKTPDIRAFIRPGDSREAAGFDPTGTYSKSGYIESLSELTKSNLAYFVEIYTRALYPGAVAIFSELNIYETPQRRYALIKEELPQSITDRLKPAELLLNKTPKTRDIALLKILDLHCFYRPDDPDTKSIELALAAWISTINWDEKHLSEHAQKPKAFFTIAAEILDEFLYFKSIGKEHIRNIGDIAEKLDLICNHVFIPRRRKSVLSRINSAWEKSIKAPAKPTKRPAFAIDTISRNYLSRKIIEETQPASVSKVIDYLSNNSAVLKDIKNSDKLHSLKATHIKKRINVGISTSTSKTIDSLRKKLGVTRSQLLVHAINYYLYPDSFKSAENLASTAKKKTDTKQTMTENKQQAKTLTPETEKAENAELLLDTSGKAVETTHTESEAAPTKEPISSKDQTPENTIITEQPQQTEPKKSPIDKVHRDQNTQEPKSQANLDSWFNRDKVLSKHKKERR